MRFLRACLRLGLPAALFVLGIAVLAQQTPPPLTPEQEEAAAKAQQMGELMEVVKKQFGPDLEIAQTQSDVTTRYLHPDKKKEAEWKYLVTGDLDGDGVEDAAIVVRFKNPLARQAQYNYKVVDPYFSYNGYGNPKVTVGFGSDDPRYHNMVLVIHGAGKEGWRAETPKEKFVIINLSFDSLYIAPLMLKKKKVMALVAEQEGMDTSSVYWDGKKYRWLEGAAK